MISTIEEKKQIEIKKNVIKSELIRFNIDIFPEERLNIKQLKLTKDSAVASWLENWIKESLKTGLIKPNNLLPKKDVLAKYFSVSSGTIQNAIRYIEDKGIVESKQRIGTLICDTNNSNITLRKQVSKRELAIVAIKKLIVDENYKVGSPVPSTRETARIIKSAQNTTRLALEYLSSIGIIEVKRVRGNQSNWILKEIPTIENNDSIEINTDTLVDQVERDLKNLITERYQINDKLAPHHDLAKELKVSVKTIHDSIRRLIEQGILKSKRGRYGTFVTRIPSSLVLDERQENSIFAPAIEACFYNYEKVEKHIKTMIRNEYTVGDKIPSMQDLSEQFKVSSNTVRKALKRLSDDNIIKFSRGRYGGTFIINMPKAEDSMPFKWIAINSERIEAYAN